MKAKSYFKYTLTIFYLIESLFALIKLRDLTSNEFQGNDPEVIDRCISKNLELKPKNQLTDCNSKSDTAKGNYCCGVALGNNINNELLYHCIPLSYDTIYLMASLITKETNYLMKELKCGIEDLEKTITDGNTCSSINSITQKENIGTSTCIDTKLSITDNMCCEIIKGGKSYCRVIPAALTLSIAAETNNLYNSLKILSEGQFKCPDKFLKMKQEAKACLSIKPTKSDDCFKVKIESIACCYSVSEKQCKVFSLKDVGNKKTGTAECKTTSSTFLNLSFLLLLIILF